MKQCVYNDAAAEMVMIKMITIRPIVHITQNAALLIKTSIVAQKLL